MSTKIRKDEIYSKLMQDEGAATVVDEESYTMELPEWADENQIKMGQKFFLLNINAMVRALLIGLIGTASSQTILKVLMFTKQSSTVALAYRRYKANALHTQVWYKYPIKPGTKAWKSLDTVRRMHVVVNKRSTRADVGIISQKDMVLTQFTFMGFHLLNPDKFGIVGTREQFEAFNHFWRVIGYMLGTEDRFNCCGETLDDTLSRLEAIREDILVPNLMFTCPEFESYTRIAIDGMWHFDPTLNYDSLLFLLKRALRVPGYNYFESEASSIEEKKLKSLRELSFYTRFRILLDIILYEYLCKIFIFRWMLNFMRFGLAILDVYPIFALWSFGKKYAYVEIMKEKK